MVESWFVCFVLAAFYGLLFVCFLSSGVSWGFSYEGVEFSSFSLWVVLMVLLFLALFICKTWDFYSALVVVVTIGLCVWFFLSSSLLVFYVCYEFVMLGLLYIIISSSGYQERLFTVKIFVVYTVFFSVPLFLLLLGLYSFGVDVGFSGVLGVEIFSWLVYLVLLGFFMKVPVWGLHQWLPLVHVESPVAGSMLLAGVLIKMGGYGVFLFIVYLGAFLSCFVGVLLVGLMACLCKMYFTSDLKVLVAYSSVVHMSFVVLGFMFSSSSLVLLSVLVVLFHSFLSTGLFYLVGCLSSIYMSRSFFVLKNVVVWGSGLMFMVFLMFILNFSFPLSGSFWAELGLVFGVLYFNKMMLIFVIFMLMFSMVVNVEVLLMVVSRALCDSKPLESVSLMVGLFSSVVWASLGLLLIV